MKGNALTVNWLENLAPATRALIENNLKPLDYVKGQFVHRTGDIADGLHYVQYGAVRMSRSNEEGKELIIIDWQPGHWFGFPPCFGSGIRKNNSVALKKTRLLYISKSTLHEIALQHPEILININHLLALQQELATARYEQATMLTLDERLQKTLQQFCQWRGTRQLEISQPELAAYLGVTKEAIGVSLNKLKSQGIVNLGYRKVEYIG